MKFQHPFMLNFMFDFPCIISVYYVIYPFTYYTHATTTTLQLEFVEPYWSDILNMNIIWHSYQELFITKEVTLKYSAF